MFCDVQQRSWSVINIAINLALHNRKLLPRPLIRGNIDTSYEIKLGGSYIGWSTQTNRLNELKRGLQCEITASSISLYTPPWLKRQGSKKYRSVFKCSCQSSIQMAVCQSLTTGWLWQNTVLSTELMSKPPSTPLFIFYNDFLNTAVSLNGDVTLKCLTYKTSSPHFQEYRL